MRFLGMNSAEENCKKKRNENKISRQKLGKKKPPKKPQMPKGKYSILHGNNFHRRWSLR